jgi:hypothetical protein
MRELAALAKRVDRRGRNAELPSDSRHIQQRKIVDPSWTQRFVFLRYGMGSSGTPLRRGVSDGRCASLCASSFTIRGAELAEHASQLAEEPRVPHLLYE